MVAESHFRVLAHLIDEGASEVSISALAAQLDWSPGHASRTVSDLETYGYVHTEQRGREKRVSLTDIDSIEQLEALLTEYRHMDLPGLIAGAGAYILYYLDQERTATELAERSGVSQATVYRRLGELQRVGVVGKTDSQYHLNDAFTALVPIVRGLLHQQHRREAAQYAEGLNFLWETHDEYLFACDTDVQTDGFYATGPARFGEFGVPLLTRDRRHYVRTDRLTEITPEEVVCHTLLIDDGSRYRTYCLLLIRNQELDQTALRERADHYSHEAAIDLRGIIDDLIEYLETEGDTSVAELPDWEEFTQTATEYGITV